MKKQYIRSVNRTLVCSARQKKEILRDLEEIFTSAADHEETEAEVIERLGSPENYAMAAEEGMGVNRKTVLRRRALLGILPPAILTPVLFLLYKSARPFSYHEQMSVGIIGGADGPTSILISTSPTNPLTAPLLLGLCILCAAAALFALVWYLRKK